MEMERSRKLFIVLFWNILLTNTGEYLCRDVLLISFVYYLFFYFFGLFISSSLRNGEIRCWALFAIRFLYDWLRQVNLIAWFSFASLSPTQLYIIRFSQYCSAAICCHQPYFLITPRILFDSSHFCSVSRALSLSSQHLHSFDDAAATVAAHYFLLLMLWMCYIGFQQVVSLFTLYESLHSNFYAFFSPTQNLTPSIHNNFYLSFAVCNQFSRGVFSMLGAVSPESFDTLHSYSNTFQMPFVTPWFPEKVCMRFSETPIFFLLFFFQKYKYSF